MRLFFKPLPLRRIGDVGHQILRTSRWDNRRLSLLTIFFLFRVTRTGIESGTVQHLLGHWRAAFRVPPNTTYKL